MWTLFFEAACHGIVAVLGVLGVLHRRRWVVPALPGGLWLLTVAAAAGFDPLGLAVTALIAASSRNLVEHPAPGWKDAARVTR